MPKDKWRNYAINKGLQQKGYIRKHSNRGKGWQACEASCSHSVQCGGEIKVQEEKIEKIDYENFRQEESNQASEGRSEGIQETDSGRCKTKKRVRSQKKQEIEN